MPPFFQGKNLLTQFLYLTFFVLGGSLIFTVIGQFLATLIYGPDVSRSTELMPGYYRFIQVLSQVGMFLIPALLFSYCSTKKVFAFNNADKKGKISLFGIALLLSVLIIPVTYFLAFLNDSMAFPKALAGIEAWMREMEISQQKIITTMISSTDISTFVLNIGIFGILPAICEEFFFRGTLQPFLNKCFKNNHIAIFVTAFVFSAIHLQFFGFIPRFLLGLYLGYLLLWSGTLWLPVFAHFMHNILSLIIQFYVLRQGLDIEDPNIINVQNYIPLIICSFIFTIIGIYCIKRVSLKKN